VWTGVEMVIEMGQPAAVVVRRMSFLKDKQWGFRRKLKVI